MTAIKVNVDNFVRAETDRMFGAIQAGAGGVNRWGHNREPTSLNQQTVIRMNRDTLYSFAVVNVSTRATITVPDAGDRYLSVMVLDQDHYVTDVYHDAGEYEVGRASTPFVTVALRILVDPNDPADLQEVHTLQDQLAISAAAEIAFELTDYDQASLDATRSALLELGEGLDGYARTFGRREVVDPVRHLIGTAGGWGGLPERGRPSTSIRIRACPWGATRSPSRTCRWTRSGRFPFTTLWVFSSRTSVMPTA